MRLCVLLFCACLLGTAEHALSSEATTPSQVSGEEDTLWNLERAYWRYVESNDLTAYSSLWHKDFLGWPSVSSSPVRKDHITDWITSQTSKGLVFKTVEFKPAAIRVTGDVAFACYWVTFRWVDKDERDIAGVGNGVGAVLEICPTVEVDRVPDVKDGGRLEGDTG